MAKTLNEDKLTFVLWATKEGDSYQMKARTDYEVGVEDLTANRSLEIVLASEEVAILNGMVSNAITKIKEAEGIA